MNPAPPSAPPHRKRIGVLGGTFDPVHYGHLRVGEEARERLSLDEVLFIPNNISPFKTDSRTTSGEIRTELLEAAIADNPCFSVWTGELTRPAPSYAVDTLRILHTENPDTELYFLTGADAFAELPRWRDPEEILRLCRFVGFTRPGYERDTVLAALPSAWLHRIMFLEMPPWDIAATALRDHVQARRSIRYWTPDAVIERIAAHGLYRD